MTLLKLAWRNVRRDRRRTAVTVAAMAFALLVLILYSGLFEGYLVGLEEDVVELELGDLQLFAPGFLERPSLYTAIEEPDGLIAALEARGYPAGMRLLGGALAASGDLSAGVRLVGLAPEREERVSRLAERVAAGSWLSAADAKGVVLGARLARALSARPGSELVLLSQAADGSLANDLYRVRGVLAGVSEAADRGTVYMTAGAFRELVVFPAGAHQIVVRRPPGTELAAAAAEARALAPELTVLTWRQLMPAIATMLDSARSLVYVIFFVVYIAVGILILNAMLMAVFERIRELGVLKALGVGPGWIMGLIVLESTFQMGLALALGLALSLPGMWLLSRIGIDVGALAGVSVAGVAMRSVWYGIYTPATIAGPIAALVVIVYAAVLYPGLKAALIQPLRAIHHP